MLILPNGIAGTLEVQTLSKDEVKLVDDFTTWCERRGLRFDLLCKVCYDRGLMPARCTGDNDPDDINFKISCKHAERVYGNRKL